MLETDELFEDDNDVDFILNEDFFSNYFDKYYLLFYLLLIKL